MATVKNFHLIESFLSEKQKEQMEAGAVLYWRHGSISFKIEKIGESTLVIKTVQEKNFSANYLKTGELADRTKEFFGKFFPDYKIDVHPNVYQEPVVNVVTPEWIQEQMASHNIRLKQVSVETGLDYTQLSAIVNGKRSFAQPIKAMFFYYFMSKEVLEKFDTLYQVTLENRAHSLQNLKQINTMITSLANINSSLAAAKDFSRFSNQLKYFVTNSKFLKAVDSLKISKNAALEKIKESEKSKT